MDIYITLFSSLFALVFVYVFSYHVALDVAASDVYEIKPLVDVHTSRRARYLPCLLGAHYKMTGIYCALSVPIGSGLLGCVAEIPPSLLASCD